MDMKMKNEGIIVRRSVSECKCESGVIQIAVRERRRAVVGGKSKTKSMYGKAGSCDNLKNETGIDITETEEMGRGKKKKDVRYRDVNIEIGIGIEMHARGQAVKRVEKGAIQHGHEQTRGQMNKV